MNVYDKDLEDRVVKLEEELERKNEVITNLLHAHTAKDAAFSMCLSRTHKKDAELLFQRYKHTLEKWGAEDFRPFDTVWLVDIENVGFDVFPYILKAIEEDMK